MQPSLREVIDVFIKFRSQKKYIVFLTVIPLLVVTSLVKAECPVCQGTGTMSFMPGIENVELLNVESEETYISRQFCEMYILYKYNVMLSLKNNGPDEVGGWIKLILREFRKGKVLDIQYLYIDFPGETTMDCTYVVWFRSGLDAPLLTEVHAELETGEIPDLTCNGTGKVLINTWHLVNYLKESFLETARVEQEFRPPIYYDPFTDPDWAEEG